MACCRLLWLSTHTLGRQSVIVLGHNQGTSDTTRSVDGQEINNDGNALLSQYPPYRCNICSDKLN